MKLKLVSYGIAKDILAAKEKEVEYDVNNVKELKAKLYSEYPDLERLRSIAFAVKEEYQDDDFQLNENDEVVIIPPVAGG